MKETLRLAGFLFTFLLALSDNVLAQTISTGAVSPAAVCPGGTVTVAYSTTGTVTGFSFKVQIAPTATPTAYTDVPTTGSATPLTATIPASTAAGAYRVRVTGTSSTTTITGSPSSTTLTVNATPAPPAVSNPPAYCQNATATPLSATASAGHTLQWYGTSATGGSASTTAPTPPTNTPGTLKYYVSQKNNTTDCESARAEITVTVTQTPPMPSATTPVNLCQGGSSSPLSATPTSGGTLNWYDSPSDTSPSATAPTPPTSATGTTTYQVSQTVGSCESARANITVNVNAKPAPPTVANPAPYCQGVSAPALSATATSGGTLRWWGTSQTGGTSSAVAPTPSTASAGATTYYVSQVVNGCESDRAGITVTVNEKPAKPAVTSPVTYCQNVTAAPLSATATTGNALKWYGTNQQGGLASDTPTQPSTTTPGTYLYYVAQRNTTTGCESDRSSIEVVVNATPGAPGVTSPVFACQNSTPAALTATGQNLKWYTQETGGQPLASAPTPPTSTTGTTAFYVSQTVNNCEGPRARLDFTVRPLPAAPTVSATALVYCQNSTAAPLSATVSAGGTLNWYGTDATGGTRSGTAPTPSTATAGDFTYYVSQTVNGCEGPRVGIPVTINPTPGAPTVTSPVNLCQGGPSSPLTATGTGANTLRWYTQASGGTASATAPTPPTTSAGDLVYYVSQITALNCESPRSAITVVVNPLPGAPTGTTNAEVCQFSGNIPLQASGENLRWYTQETGGTAQTTTPSQSSDQAGTFNYFVSQTRLGCEGPRAKATILVKPQPGLPGVQSFKLCQFDKSSPVTATGENLKWFNSDGNPFPTPPTPSTDQGATFVYLVTQTVNGCESPRARLTVEVQTTPPPGVASPVTYCVDAQATPLSATGSRLEWTDPFGRVSTTAPTPPTQQPTNDQEIFYYVTQTGDNGCKSPRSTIRLVVNPRPTASITGSTTVNLGRPATLTVTYTSVPPFSLTLSDGRTKTSTTLQDTIVVLPRQTTIYQIQGIENPCGRGLPGNPATATINVLIPTITTGIIAETRLCAGSQITVPFTTTGNFNEGNRFRVQLADTTTKQYIDISPSVQGTGPIQATIPTSTVQGLYFVRVIASNPAIPVPGSNSTTILNVRQLPTAALTGSRDIFEGESAQLNVAFRGDGPWTFTYGDSLRTFDVTTNANPHLITVTPARTTTYRLTNVTNGCGTGSVSGTATIRVLPVLGVEPADPLLDAVQVYPVPVQQQLTIDVGALPQKETIRLTLSNMNGQVILQQPIRQSRTPIDLSRQPSGLYFLRVQVGDRSTVRKVLKQ